MSDKLNDKIHALDEDNKKLREVNREQLTRLQNMYAKEALNTTQLKALRTELKVTQAELKALRADVRPNKEA